MRLIVRFERLEKIRYISQLDILRTIHRALRRADIPVAYSEGFNPQPKVSFGFALSVGMVSYGEYMDIQLKNDIEENVFVEKMNEVMPEGMRFTDAVQANGNVPKIGRMIDCAEYETTFLSDNPAVLLDKINEFFSQNEIIIERHSKKGASFIDAKPWIYSFNAEITDNEHVKLTTVQALSEQMSIRIDDVAVAVMKWADGAAKHFSALKKDTLIRNNGRFITPVEYVRLIETCA